MEEKPHRRWFWFRLRTLFVVVTVAALGANWIGYQLNWIRARKDMLSRPDIVMRPETVKSFGQFLGKQSPSEVEPPGILKLFGEQGHAMVICKEHATAEDVIRVKALFPEAEVLSFKEFADKILPGYE